MRAQTVERFDCHADGPHDLFNEAEARLTRRPSLYFVPLTPGEVTTRLTQTVKSYSFGPFDEKRYGFHGVNVFLERTLVPEEERSSMNSNATLWVYARTSSSTGERWWRLFEGDPIWSGDDLDAGEELTVDEDDSNGEGQHPPLRLATPDRALPLFHLSVYYHTFGANSGADIQRRLLLDFRSTPPLLSSALECVNPIRGGVCTAFDALFGKVADLDCPWDPARQDFRCQEKETLLTGWGSRQGSRFFYLQSNLDLPPPSTLGHQPQTLEEFARYIEEDEAWMKRSVLLYKLGAVIPIARVEGAQPGVRHYVFAAPGRASAMSVRFFLVTCRGEESWWPQEIRMPRAWDNKLDESPEWESFSSGVTPEEPLRTYHVSQIHKGAGGLHVFQVVASEGNARALFWVGVEPKDDYAYAGAIRLASDAPVYEHCRMMVREPSAFFILVQHDPFQAELHFTPSYQQEMHEDFVSLIEPRLDPAEAIAKVCGVKELLKWYPTNGFIIYSRSPDCPESKGRYRILIQDDGTLQVIPLPETPPR